MGWRRQESRAESILGTSVPWYAAAAAGRRFYVSHTLRYLTCETQVNSASLQTPQCFTLPRSQPEEKTELYILVLELTQ